MKYSTLVHIHDLLESDVKQRTANCEEAKKDFSDFRKLHGIDDWGRYVQPENKEEFNLLSDRYTAAHRAAIDAAVFLEDFENSDF